MTPRPMLLAEYRDHVQAVNTHPYVFIQPKLDGIRAVGNTRTGEIFSREGNLFHLPIISSELLRMGRDVFTEWLDGELYKHGFSEQKTYGLIRRHSDRVQFHIFDSMTPGGFSNRFIDNQKTDEYENIISVETEKIKTKEIESKYLQFLKDGYEGAVIRVDNIGYENYRTSSQAFRVKPDCDNDCF